MSPTVAFVVSTTAEDDAQLLAVRLRYLLERGWDAWLFCKGARWADEPALRDDDLRERIELAPTAKADSSPFDARLRSLQPDLVHFDSGHAAVKGLRKGQLRGSKIAISFRTDGQDVEFSHDLDLLWERGDVLFFRSRIALELALGHGCPEERAAILNPPVRPPDPEYRREPGDRSLRVLSAGPLLWQQGFEHSIHAIRMLLDQGVPCEYRIIGDGEHLQAVAFARHQLGLHDHVHLLPDEEKAAQLPDQLRSADVFVDPAVAGTTSSAPLVTALANGVPFVATAREPSLADGAGIEVPRRDPRAIATALARLAADRELRERMGRRGEQLSGIWRMEDHLAELERLYGAMLTGAPR